MNNAIELSGDASEDPRWDGRIELIYGRKVEGWACDRSAPDVRVEVEVLCDGVRVGFACADRYRRDLFLAGAGDGRHGFEILCDFSLTADFQIRIVGTEYFLQRHGDIASRSQSEILDFDPLMIYLESARVTPRGIIEVSGWAAGYSAIEELQIFLAGSILGQPELHGPRPDVQEAYPEFVNAGTSGFLLKAEIDDAALLHPEISVAARLLGGVTRTVSKELQIPSVIRRKQQNKNEFHHFFERSLLTTGGFLKVDGWVVSAEAITAIDVLVDGKNVGRAKFGLVRPDVGNFFPSIPSARDGGFSFESELGGSWSGEHLITLVAETEAGTTQALPLPMLAQEVSSVDECGTAGAESDQMRFHLDVPAVSEGVATEPVRGMFSIAGWAIARSGIANIDIYLDSLLVGAASRGMRRLDINGAFPDWSGSLLSGFAMMLPRKLFTGEQHTIRVEIKDNEGALNEIKFDVLVDANGEDARYGALRERIPQAEVDLKLDLIEASAKRPVFTIGVLVDGVGKEASGRLRKTLDSLRRQTFDDWRVLPLATKPALAAQVFELAAEFDANIDPRRSMSTLGDQRMLSDVLAPWRATGGRPYFALLRAGDRLSIDALLEMALEAATHPCADFIYSDDRRNDVSTQALSTFFKPEWSPDLLLSTNYIGSAWCASFDAVAESRLRVGQLARLGEYDTVLRLTEKAKQINRIPVVLSERERGVGDSETQEIHALNRAIKRRGLAGEVFRGDFVGSYRVRRFVATQGLVSIIMPTIAARGLVKTSIESIRKYTAYKNYEIICIDNIKDDASEWKPWLQENADKVVEFLEPFNWSRFNNVGVQAAKGEYLLFINDDVEVLDPYWLHSLLEHVGREEVGVVGPQLLYSDFRIQHAGMFLASSDARHIFRFLGEGEPGPFGLARVQRNIIAVTGACMLVRRSVFEHVGGFNEKHSVVNNDLDFCLRVQRAGKVVVYTPHTRLIHHEMASRAKMQDVFDPSFTEEWRNIFLLGDPYFHPALSRDDMNYAPEGEPPRLICAGRPLLARDKVKRILVLKLDHVGDFITGLPAIQRLKMRFPQAEIHLLAPKASVMLAYLEPAIANTIEFNFFHAVSQQGRRELTEEELQALEEKLLPYEFDIAVDLRKHADTRQILQRTGARLLAGFDFRNEQSFLDVALEWEGDSSYVGKRAHVADDYVALVERISLACERDRSVVAAPSRDRAVEAALNIPALADMRPGLFNRKVVCVHPASGNDLRQWPPEYFAALIDLLVDIAGVNVVIIGTEGERPIAQLVLDEITRRDRVWSLVGKTSMRDVPMLLRAASLFVGNNSGPHHIAAALGTPTIGVHSGVVSAQEWGPLGPSAVAIQREMTCSPCYVEGLNNCFRDYACMRGLRPADVFRICQQMLGAKMEQ
ncbi:glycosyltransferase [Rhodoblastus acidophilus]|uniref:Glycosyltransferase n=1 Tax=Candidatus Rhodoblastus alkanivorans TaxID=2954117 RepID=A0ABS9Z8G0_9HYPH|nr:glycosyltransferase family 9 protein [Candidatus Rhodoblastus alkanivorans]MCI4679469.1 glycosyltransferase [Candidatus Rhodoblastus alkanivorans]MCI4683914.1 glycosyltransferase [Candidatus Rhodoblastus alkanivorans]MDI4641233.1 glycosyltransferase [Rhodoblastus acidophilus]